MKANTLFLIIICASIAAFSQPQTVFIPSGTFVMGISDASNASPAHTVTLTHDFNLGKYEITNKQYTDILNIALSEGELLLSGDTIVKNASGDEQILIYLNLSFYISCDISFNHDSFEIVAGKENYPVINVSWYGAAFYCNMLSRINGLEELYDLNDWSCSVYGLNGYRLPTEAEWEYAASYNDDRLYPWGNNIDISYANYMDYPGNSTLEVGSFAPLGDNQLGVCDMSGNLHEWTHDWLNNYPVSPQIDPINEDIYNEKFKVFRGGSWFTPSFWCTNIYRGSAHRDFTFPYLGFRVLVLETSTDVLQSKVNDNILIYPNPTSNICNVEAVGSYTYEVYNTFGVRVLSGSFVDITQIDFSKCKKGSYIIELNSLNCSSVKKIIVL